MLVIKVNKTRKNRRNNLTAMQIYADIRSNGQTSANMLTRNFHRWRIYLTSLFYLLFKVECKTMMQTADKVKQTARSTWLMVNDAISNNVNDAVHKFIDIDNHLLLFQPLMYSVYAENTESIVLFNF
jgi:hypothetical protein